MRIEERIKGDKAKETYHLIRRSGTVSKVSLLEQSGLANSTLTRILDDLLALGLIEEVGLGVSTGGRRPKLYRTHPTYAYVFGLNISRTYTRLVLCDMHLNKLDAYFWPMTESTTPSLLIDKIARKIGQIQQKHNLSKDELAGLGIGAVGPLDRNNGVILAPLYFPAPGWTQVSICDELEQRLEIPVLLDNGANTALLGEYWHGDAEMFQHILYVHNGVGLRSAMITNNELIYGAVDMEGAIGQMIIQTDGLAPRDPSGNYGCLESYVTIHALERQTKNYIKQGRQTVLQKWVRQPEQIQFSHLIKALEAEDVLVTEVVTQAATYFGIGLANLLNVLHPQKVILGGPVMLSHPLFFQVATQVALEKTYYYPDYQVVFSRGRLGDEALAIGAASLILNRLTAAL